jgi:subtilisin family serine protease
VGRGTSVVALVVALGAALVVPPASAQTGAFPGPVVPEPQDPVVEPAAGEVVPGEFIVTLAPAVSDQAVEQVSDELAADADGEVLDTFTQAIDGFVLDTSDEEATALLDDPRVAAVQENGVVSGSATQTLPSGWFAEDLWGLDRIDQPSRPIDDSYSYPNAAGAGVEVYIIDSGVRPSHEALDGRATAAFDVFDGTAKDTNGIDCNGHGTHVAGTVGGDYVGVAKEVTLTGVRVLDCAGNGTDAGVIAGINYAIGDHTSGLAVANMSLGGSASTALDNAVQAAIDDGITMVVAAGNDDVDACTQSPARAANAITVGATNSSDVRSTFSVGRSNFGSCVDLFAPGSNIISAWIFDPSDNPTDLYYAALNGTSMASPHVAGAAALYLQANPTATPAQVWAALQALSVQGVLTDLGTGSPNRLLQVPVPAGAPTGLTATPGNGQVALSWTAPSSAGNTPITSYRVYRNSTVVAQTANGSTTNHTVTGLTNGQAATWTVRAANAAGPGAASAGVAATPRTTPGAPTGVAATPGDEQVQVGWSAPASDGGAAVTAYRVFRDGVQVHQTANGSTTTFTDTGRTNGSTYEYEVSAVNVAGEGPRSTPPVAATPLELADAPTGVQATPGNAQVQLSWTAPTDTGGLPITSYRVFRNGGLTAVHQTADGSTLSWTDTGRTNGTTYTYTVAAVTGAGQGATSSPPASATPRTVPAAPVLSATVGDEQVSLSWTAPANGGSPITRYRVFVDDAQVHETADGSTLTYVVTDLENGVAYDFEVAAVNEVGEGARSTLLTRTPADPPSGPTFLDVAPSHPFYLDIEWMADQGISTGYVPGPTYRPSNPVTRQAMSAFMYRLADSPTFTAPATSTFGDVSPSNLFYDEIEWLADNGISTGTAASPKPLFKPSSPVSRAAMSAFMYRLAGRPAFVAPGAGSTTFGDVGTGHPFYDEIEWMAAEGITTGTAASPKPLYLPGSAVSRQAMSAFMHRLHDGPGVGL